MFHKLQKIIAKVALASLAIQMLVMVAPTAAHAGAVLPLPPYAGVIESFTLYNATTNAPIMTIDNGAKINMALTEVGTNLNIVANTLPATVGSVKFVLTGTEAYTRTENAAPYALKGDSPTGIYSDWSPAEGLYNLVATPYELTGGVNPGTPSQVNFTIYNDPTAPTASSTALGNYLLNESVVATNSPLDVNIEYDEIMDIASTPSLVFSTDISSSVNCTGSWVGGALNYLYTCILTDADVELSGVTATVSGATDLAGNEQVPYILPATLDIDTRAPAVTTSFSPTIVNNLGNVIDVYFSSVEPMVLANAFVYKQDGAVFVPANPALVQPDTSNLALFHSIQVPSNFFTGALNSLEISFVVTDEAGNNTIGTVTIPVDMIAPTAVTNLLAVGNADGTVTLTWINPVDGYVGLQVKRDGVFLTTLPVGTTTFTDTSTVRGQTYSYTVTAYDAAGNETMATPVQVTVPSFQVASVVSDSYSYYAPAVVATDDQGTVTSADNQADTLGDEDDKTEEGLPSWAILLLLILAAIGGYLIYNQKPVTTPVVPVAKKGTNDVPKKTTPNKKK